MKISSEFSLVKEQFPDLDIVLKSHYRVVAYSPNQSLLYHEWLEDNAEMDDETFKSEILLSIKSVEQLRPSFFIVNDKNRQVKFTNELNEFLMYNFMPVYSHTSVKQVLIIRCDFLSMQSELEIMMEEISKGEDKSPFKFYDHISQVLGALHQSEA